MIRRCGPALLALLVVACSSTPHRPSASEPRVVMERAYAASATPRAPRQQPAFNPCAPTRQHLDSDYTPGGLYAPGVADSGPATAIDVSGVQEPVPRLEPRARYGNRSPYSVLGKSYRVLDSANGYHERGLASWYGAKFNGRATSSGELYDMCMFSAAHKTLPLPSFVRVTNLDNGRSLIVRVNDRGPFHSGRVMDLSYAAAVRLGVDRTGTARVELQSLEGDRDPAAPAGRDLESLEEVAADRVGRNRQTQSAPSRLQGGLRSGAGAIIRVASFGEKNNARRLANRLQDAGLDDVDLDHAEVAGLDVWRVQIGPVSFAKLDGLLERLRQLELPNPRVVSQ